MCPSPIGSRMCRQFPIVPTSVDRSGLQETSAGTRIGQPRWPWQTWSDRDLGGSAVDSSLSSTYTTHTHEAKLEIKHGHVLGNVATVRPLIPAESIISKCTTHDYGSWRERPIVVVPRWCACTGSIYRQGTRELRTTPQPKDGTIIIIIIYLKKKQVKVRSSSDGSMAAYSTSLYFPLQRCNE